jgi:glutamyl-tRNA reductase
LLAQAHGGRSISLGDLPQRLHEFDIVISCTASTLPLIGLGAVKSALRKRKSKPMFMVDLAVPRDIEPEVKDLRDVYLYTVDDLTEVINTGQVHRQAAVQNAEVIIDDGVQKFMTWLAHRRDVPLIQELNFQADHWRQQELIRARKLLDKGQSIESVLDALSVGMMKKMLNGPLRELNHTEEPQRVKAREAVKQMFLRP